MLQFSIKAFSSNFSVDVVPKVVIGEHTIRSDYYVSDDDDYDDIRLKDEVASGYFYKDSDFISMCNNQHMICKF